MGELDTNVGFFTGSVRHGRIMLHENLTERLE